MLFKIAVVVCLSFIVYQLWYIGRLISKAQRKKFIDKLRDYGARRN